MTKSKPITDKGLILFYDYEFIFNFLTDDELGKLIRLLIKNKEDMKLNQSDNDKINNAYNYIISVIRTYKEKKEFYSEKGKIGGNPTLKGTLNPTLNPTLKGTLNPTLNPTHKGRDKLHDITIHDITIQKNKILERDIARANEDFLMTPSEEENYNAEKKLTTRYTPSLEDCTEYFILIRSTEDEAQKFFDHYTANGWMTGQALILDWRAKARNWVRSIKNFMTKEDRERQERKEFISSLNKKNEVKKDE